MNGRNSVIWLLAVLGVYFLIFHTAPFPFNHEAIGLPPYHAFHAAFGVVLILIAGFLKKKK